MKKSYIAIVREIEEMREKGLDDDTISNVLRAKYDETSIERMYTEAQREREEAVESEENESEEEPEGFSKKTKIIIGTFGGVVAVLFIMVFVALFSGTDTTTSNTPSRYELDSKKRLIFYTSQEYLKKHLTYGESAKFAPYTSASVNEMVANKDNYIVNSQVHAPNAYGVFITYNYKMRLKEIGKDKYVEITYELY